MSFLWWLVEKQKQWLFRECGQDESVFRFSFLKAQQACEVDSLDIEGVKRRNVLEDIEVLQAVLLGEQDAAVHGEDFLE